MSAMETRGADRGAQQAPERAAEQAAEQAADRAARRAAILDRSGVAIPFVGVLLLGAFLAPNFLTGANIRGILINTAILAVVGYGMTFAITIRGLDLSVGSVAALGSVVAAATVNSAGPALGIAAGLAVGAAAGLVNGLLIALVKIPPFVATLAMLSAARGAALVFAGGQRIQVGDASFRSLATTSILGIPLPFWLALALGAIAYAVLERVRWGRHVCAVGGNPEAAVEAGLRRTRIIIAVYVLSGIAAGISGVLVTAQLGTVDATPILGLELQAIAVAVLGGTSLRGGTGNIVGTLAAALVLGMISSGLNLLNVPGYYQYLALGAVLLLALALDAARIRLRSAGRGEATS